MNLPEISVIIPFRGDKKELSGCLEGLNKQNIKKKFEIIIVESRNNLGSELLINSINDVLVISSSLTMYPGKARDLGVKYSRADLLVFIDADCIPVPDWLSECYSSIKNGNDIVIGPVINLYPFHPVASIDNVFLFSDFQKRRPQKNIAHFAGCNFGITKELFDETGKFQEDVEIAEDTNFSKFALQKGKIYFNKKMIVKHSGRKEYSEFIKHHESFGFYKGYLNLKTSHSQDRLKENYFYPILLGAKRLIYISIRTLQWNPVGLLRIIFYFPFLLIGISAWINGFRKGNRKFLSEMSSSSATISLKNSQKKG